MSVGLPNRSLSRGKRKECVCEWENQSFLLCRCQLALELTGQVWLRWWLRCSYGGFAFFTCPSLHVSSQPSHYSKQTPSLSTLLFCFTIINVACIVSVLWTLLLFFFLSLVYIRYACFNPIQSISKTVCLFPYHIWQSQKSLTAPNIC